MLGNTYHLMLRPGAERIAALGGLHTFMNWHGPILTDSGGFQVMSLSELRKITDHGVTFRSHIDGDMVELTPERAIEIQALLGADISMQLDECIKLPIAARRDRARHAAVARLGGALQARLRERAGRAARCSASCRAATTRRCARRARAALTGIGFHGYAIGGLAVGEPQDDHAEGGGGDRAAAAGRPAALPDGRRHAGRSAGVGGARHRHVRLRDADPQRPPRRGVHAATASINLANARHRDDPRPLDEESPYEPTRTYSRAYLLHLVRVNEMLGQMLLSAINLAYYQQPDGGHARRDRAGAVRRVPRRDARGLAARRHCAAVARAGTVG